MVNMEKGELMSESFEQLHHLQAHGVVYGGIEDQHTTASNRAIDGPLKRATRRL